MLGQGLPNVPLSASDFDCDAERILPAGGALISRLLPPSATPFERRFAIRPPVGIYTATREKPVQFTLGTFVVPKNQALALCEFRFLPYRFDGVIAGQTIPLEDRRLSLSIGYDLRVGPLGRSGNIVNQAIPGSPLAALNPAYPALQTGGTVMQGLPAAPSGLGGATVETIYGILALSGENPIAPGLAPAPSQPSQFVTTLFGASMLPQSQDGHQGPTGMPFTYYANENDNVLLTVGAFAPVQIPLAYFEGWLMGYLLPINALKKMLEKVRLCA